MERIMKWGIAIISVKLASSMPWPLGCLLLFSSPMQSGATPASGPSPYSWLASVFSAAASTLLTFWAWFRLLFPLLSVVISWLLSLWLSAWSGWSSGSGEMDWNEFLLRWIPAGIAVIGALVAWYKA